MPKLIRIRPSVALVRTKHDTVKNNHSTATLQAGDQWRHEFSADITGFSLRATTIGPGELLYRQGGSDVEAVETDPALPVDPQRKDFLRKDGHFVALLATEDGTYTVAYRPLQATWHERFR